MVASYISCRYESGINLLIWLSTRKQITQTVKLFPTTKALSKDQIKFNVHLTNPWLRRRNHCLQWFCVCGCVPESSSQKESDCTPVCLRPNLEVGREASYLLPFLLCWDLRWRGLNLWGTLLTFFWRALEQQGTKTTLSLCLLFSDLFQSGDSLCTKLMNQY